MSKKRAIESEDATPLPVVDAESEFLTVRPPAPDIGAELSSIQVRETSTHIAVDGAYVTIPHRRLPDGLDATTPAGTRITGSTPEELHDRIVERFKDETERAAVVAGVSR